MSSHFPWFGTKTTSRNGDKTLGNPGDKCRQLGGVNCHNWGVWNAIKPAPAPAPAHLFMCGVTTLGGNQFLRLVLGVNCGCSTLVLLPIDSFKRQPKTKLTKAWGHWVVAKSAGPLWAFWPPLLKWPRTRACVKITVLWVLPVAKRRRLESPSSESVIGGDSEGTRSSHPMQLPLRQVCTGKNFKINSGFFHYKITRNRASNKS